MRPLATFVCAVLATGNLAACGTPASTAPVEESIKAATAEAVAGVDASTVEVVDSEQSAAKWTWIAKANGKVFHCDADNLMRLPSCTERS